MVLEAPDYGSEVGLDQSSELGLLQSSSHTQDFPCRYACALAATIHAAAFIWFVGVQTFAHQFVLMFTPPAGLLGRAM